MFLEKLERKIVFNNGVRSAHNFSSLYPINKERVFIYFCSPRSSLRAQRNTNIGLAAPEKLKKILEPCCFWYKLCVLPPGRRP